MDIEIQGGFIKLEALLKLAGLTGTGGEAKIRIADGEAAVNGKTCLMRGKKLHPGDEVRFSGETIRILEGK